MDHWQRWNSNGSLATILATIDPWCMNDRSTIGWYLIPHASTIHPSPSDEFGKCTMHKRRNHEFTRSKHTTVRHSYYHFVASASLHLLHPALNRILMNPSDNKTPWRTNRKRKRVLKRRLRYWQSKEKSVRRWILMTNADILDIGAREEVGMHIVRKTGTAQT